jgi:hypothetical protein
MTPMNATGWLSLEQQRHERAEKAGQCKACHRPFTAASKMPGARTCRLCYRERSRLWHQRKKATNAAAAKARDVAASNAAPEAALARMAAFVNRLP